MAVATLIPEQIMDGLSIKASYDKITFEIRNHHHYIRPGKLKIKGFSRARHHKKYYPVEYRHPGWDIDVFLDFATGNKITFLINDDRLRVSFTPEGKPFTLKQIESVLNLLCSQFRKTVNAETNSRGKVEDLSSIITAQPYLFEVEVAIDFIGGHTYFLLYELGYYTHKRLSRSRKTVRGDDDNCEEKNGVTLFNSIHTHYLGSKRSSHASRRYLRVVRNIDKPVVRFEMVIRHDYLRKHGFNTIRDLTKFNASEYWKDNYSFFEIRYDQIERKLHQVLADGDPVGFPMHMVYCTCLTENLEPVKVNDLFKRTTDRRGKKLFPNPSRFRRPVLQELHDAVTEALKELKI